MEEKKRIDRLFQEKLKDFEVFPEPHVWKNIQQDLMKKKRRRIVPLWLRLGSAAAVLLLLISTGFWYFDQDNTLPNQNDKIPNSVDSESVEQKKEDNTKQINSLEQRGNEIITNQENSSSDKTELTKSTTTQTQKTTTSTLINDNKNLVEITTKSNESTNALANNDIVKEGIEGDSNKDQEMDQKIEPNNQELITENDAIANNQKTQQEDFQLTKNDIAEAIEDQLNEDNKEADQLKKWSVGTTIAPVYFNSLAKGSPINTSLAGNDKEANTSLSYGVKLNLQINDRLSLQSGINNVELAYKTQGVTALIASSELQFSDGNIDTNIDGVNLIAISNNQVAAQSSELGAPRGVVNLRGDLNQSLSYIEIPMEAKYALVNKKIGVHLVGGVSTYLLYGNKISLLDQNGSTTLGEASNINDINFSGNLGLDLDYKLNKKLFINVSPMFKYQMNTFSKNDGGFKPYYLGVYTGLNFRF